MRPPTSSPSPWSWTPPISTRLPPPPRPGAGGANAAAAFEPVPVVVAPADLDAARAHLSGSIELREAPLDDAWMRDMGPTYVIDRDAEGGPKLGGVDWIFNGWGAP